MTNREKAIEGFLAQSGWADASRDNLAGDASNRRYERINGQKGQVVLMDAPPDRGEDVRPFVQVTNLLRGFGLSAPAIHASDVEQGFLILEDLGDTLFARVMAHDLEKQIPLYEAATDVLVELHKAPLAEIQGFAAYDPPLMANMAALAWRWYLRGIGEPYKEKAAEFEAAFTPVLEKHTSCDVLIQRDYHAENLLWLPEREGVARVGLLDYQDAMLGHRAYDLVSLLQDARRDVPPEIEQLMLNRYIDGTGQNEDMFTTAYHVLGAQRNLRILGVFARLCLYSGKAHYVDFIPRVWSYLLRDLEHPALASVRDFVLRDLPAPTPRILDDLKDQCATIPTL